jgi:ribosome biogenesis GTPase
MGRRSPDDSGRREQAPKKVRGFARGHGVHHRHRPGRGAPRPFGSGRNRTEEGTRLQSIGRMGDEALEELANAESPEDLDKRLEELGAAGDFGAKLEGASARGLVLEVRKGNFLTRILTARETPAACEQRTWKPGEVLRTFVRGTLQQFDLGLASMVAPGDVIEVVVPPQAAETELVQTQLHAILTKVLPRRNEFRRLHPSGRSIQTLAANLDRVIIVASAAEPEFRPGFVDRVLVCAMSCDIPVALVLNKTDLGVQTRDEKLLDVYRQLNLQVLKISVADPAAPQGDFPQLEQLLVGKRTLLTGHSGVGKSTILLALDSSLTPETIRIGEVSSRTHKGAHTTTHAKLYELRGGSTGHPTQVIDTPGVREFTPADTDRRNLWGWFPEIARLQGQCAFANCSHTIEKGCAVLAALERGEIHPRRHQSYVRIYETLPN